MTGETDLTALLASLQPILDADEFGFGVWPNGTPLPNGLAPWAVLHEDEGVTLIATASALIAAEVPHVVGWARITLRVHSSLQAVGLTAAIATALAGEGVSANVIAGYYHDHVFVPWDRRNEAMAIVARCAAGPVS